MPSLEKITQLVFGASLCSLSIELSVYTTDCVHLFGQMIGFQTKRTHPFAGVGALSLAESDCFAYLAIENFLTEAPALATNFI